MFLAGCGDDGPPSDARADYIARADRICAEANRQGASINDRLRAVDKAATDPEAALAEAAPILREAATSQREANEKLKSLPAPSADRDEINKLNALHDDQVELVDRMADAAEAGDVQRLQTTGAEVEPVSERARDAAQDFGFKECGAGVPTS